jgi:two-component sensor histidine kinase
VNELICNALKHGFRPGQRGEIKVGLRHEANHDVVLSVGDTGVGLPEEFDILNLPTLGLQVVALLADQLGGTLTMHRSNPTEFILTFPIGPPSGGLH